MTQRLTNPTSVHEDVGSTLASLSGLRIWRCCELWCRLSAIALIHPLAWEPPCVRWGEKKKKNSVRTEVPQSQKITCAFNFLNK